MELTEAQYNRCERLVEGHSKYQQESLESVGVPADRVNEIMFFYQAAARHFYGHGIEDKRGRPRKPRQPKNQAAMFPKEVIEG